MAVHAQSVDTTCTARIINNFLYDVDVSQQRLEHQKTYIIDRLNQAKRDLIVNVIAFVIGGRQAQSAKQLEEIGFKCLSDYHNYKYPADSKNLLLYSMDMNNWEIKEEPKKAENPFSVNPSVVTYSHPHPVGFRASGSDLQRWRVLIERYEGPPQWIDIPDQLMEAPPVAYRVKVRFSSGLGASGDVNSFAWDIPADHGGRIVSFKRAD